MLKKTAILFAVMVLSMNAMADMNSDHAQMEQYRQKFQTDIQQFKIDQKKLEADREAIKQDQMQMKQMRESMMRERIEERKKHQEKITAENPTNSQQGSTTQMH